MKIRKQKLNCRNKFGIMVSDKRFPSSFPPARKSHKINNRDARLRGQDEKYFFYQISLNKFIQIKK